MQTIARGTPLLWVLVATHMTFVVSNRLFEFASGAVVPAVAISLGIIITTLHALRRYSVKEYLVFMALTFVISSTYENMSVITGFPFGEYYYSDKIGPKLFLVPLVIAPAYFAGGYYAWTIAHVLLGLYDQRPRGLDVVRVPMIAAMIMVMWDMIMDPGNATVNQSWIWETGGSYFGVPVSNYLGWLLCVYTFFQLFALYLARGTKAAETTAEPALEARRIDRSYWYLAVIPFFAMSLSWVMRAFTFDHTIVTDPSGQVWNTQHLFETMLLVAIFTMWFVCLLSAMLISKQPSAPAAE